jgi:lantibiotic modifying enzyme
MAWALLHLSAAVDDARFRHLALDAIAYERTLFTAEHGNWWDLREAESGAATATAGHCATTWCHGAPGIALARASTLGLLDDTSVREEILTAAATTAREGFGDNHSLCHGDLGNLEALKIAGERLEDAELGAAAARIVPHVVDDIRTAGWRCGNPLGVESPGLMTGLAGIGYGLLRLAEPERVPSVLLLEPPRPPA